jgi:hypothetical protein
MKESLPVMNYNRYEETAFDVTNILEGIVNSVVVFGVLSLQQADGVKNPGLPEAYNGLGQLVKVFINGGSDVKAWAQEVSVIPFEVAYQRVKSDALAKYLNERRWALLDRGPATAVTLGGKHPPIPVQKPKPVVEPSPEPKPIPVVPKSPITMTELLLQMAAMQTDFDLRMQVVTKRLAALEAK